MMWPIVINVLALAAAIILIFILRILPASEKDRNNYLLVLLGILVLHLCGGMLLFGELMPLPAYAIFSLAVVSLYGPGMYFYIRKLLELNSAGILWHFAIIELALLAMIGLQAWALLVIPVWAYNVFYILVLSSYFVAIVKLKRSASLRYGKRWMKTLVIGFGGLILLYGLASVWMTLDFDSVAQVVTISTSVYNFFCFLFLLIAIKQIFTDPEAFSSMKIRIPYKSAELKNFDSELEMITAFVLDEKAYRDAELNRRVISAHTGISVHRISEVINKTHQKNFNDWVNDHRISEARQYLLHTDMSVKEICYEVGFNSKSAFHKAFKKRWETTPSSFRKMYKGES